MNIFSKSEIGFKENYFWVFFIKKWRIQSKKESTIFNPHENQIAGNSIQWFIRLLIEMNISKARIFKGTSLTDQWLEQPEATISPSDYKRIISTALDVSKDTALGFKVGRHNILSGYGASGYVVISSRTFGEAADMILKYWELLGMAMKIVRKYEESDQIWEILPIFSMKDNRLWEFEIESFLSSLYTAVSFLTDREIRFEKLYLSYPEPAHGRIYRDMFKCPVFFGKGIDAIWIANDVFEMPIIMSDAQMLEICKEQCTNAITRLKAKDELLESIQMIIVSSSFKLSQLNQIADKLSISPRTLQRRLRMRDKTFQSVLDSIRTDISKAYLTHTELTVDQISERIGFSQTSNFSYAFKKWTGVPPGEFRAQNKVL